MQSKIFFSFLFVLFGLNSFSQTNTALAMSEVLAYSARFNPADTRQLEIIRNIKPSLLISRLKTDNEKNAFWLNIYNSMMLIILRDTNFQGVYGNFYKKKNVVIAGKAFSLFDIEHEFLLAGTKMKSHGFKKSKLIKDTVWLKLMPQKIDSRVLFCMYRGLYGYPPFQVIENGDIGLAYLNVVNYVVKTEGNTKISFDWVKPYSKFILADSNNRMMTGAAIVYTPTPLAVYIKNFYPKYEGVIFKKEEENPWLKKSIKR